MKPKTRVLLTCQWIISRSGAILKVSTEVRNCAARLHELSKKIEKFQAHSATPIVCSWLLKTSSLMPVWILRLFYNKMMNTMTISSFAGPESRLDIFRTATLTDIALALGHPPGSVGKGFKTVLCINMALLNRKYPYSFCNLQEQWYPLSHSQGSKELFLRLTKRFSESMPYPAILPNMFMLNWTNFFTLLNLIFSARRNFLC